MCENTYTLSSVILVLTIHLFISAFFPWNLCPSRKKSWILFNFPISTYLQTYVPYQAFQRSQWENLWNQKTINFTKLSLHVFHKRAWIYFQDFCKIRLQPLQSHFKSCSGVREMFPYYMNEVYKICLCQAKSKPVSFVWIMENLKLVWKHASSWKFS